MFYEEEEVAGGFFEGSLEAVERQSALRSAVILQGIDSLLYANEDEDCPDGDAPGPGLEPATPSDGDGEEAAIPRFDYDRHCGMGYNAHHDGVDADEVVPTIPCAMLALMLIISVQLLAWRGRFNYLMVRPAAVIEVEDDCPPSLVATTSESALPPALVKTGKMGADLCVVGMQKTILPLLCDTVVEDGEECVLAQHGSLEEVIALDVTPHDASDQHEGECSPRTSMHAEVVAGIFDALWPDVVEKLAPLVARVTALPAEDIQPRAAEESYGGCADSEW